MDAEDFDSLFDGADFDGLDDLLVDPGSPASEASTEYPSTDYTTDQSLFDDCDEDATAATEPSDRSSSPANPPSQQCNPKRLRVPKLTTAATQPLSVPSVPQVPPPQPSVQSQSRHGDPTAAKKPPLPGEASFNNLTAPLAPKMMMMPFIFNMAALPGLPGMALQPLAPPPPAASPCTTTTLAAPSRPPLPEAERAIRVARKVKAATEYEERRRKNREAADRSRLKKRALLSALPAANDSLQRRVADLEAGLAASQAEANSLRDQVTFLRSLLGNSFSAGSGFINSLNSSNDSVSMSAGAVAGQAALAASSALAAASSASSNAANPPGALVLALACVLTLNNCGGMLLVVSEWGSEWTDGVAFSSGGTEGSGHGGRVLLSVQDDSNSASSTNLGSVQGWGNAGLFPDSAVAAASLLSLCLLLRIFYHALLIPALQAGRGYALSATSNCALPMWGSCVDGSSRWAACLTRASFWLLGRRRNKAHKN